MSQKYYQDDYVTLYHGDCLDILRDLPENSIDSVVTDPPYGLATNSSKAIVEVVNAWAGGDKSHIPSKGTSKGMGSRFDSTVGAWDVFCPPPAIWEQAFRVLKPGGFLLASSAPRMVDVMSISIRIGGFEIWDQIAWIRGGGMPKGYNIGKMITALQRGFSPEASGISRAAHEDGGVLRLTEDGNKWRGWGQRLKPANEPIIVARKPHEGTLAENVLKFGTGGLNIDATRYGDASPSIERKAAQRKVLARGSQYGGAQLYSPFTADIAASRDSDALGRWPTDVALDTDAHATMVEEAPQSAPLFPVFKYSPVAPPRERPSYVNESGETVRHPTVKPLELMRWLVRLVSAPGATILDPFAGTGTTAEACVAEGFKCIAIEREESYLPLIMQRITKTTEMTLDLGGVQ